MLVRFSAREETSGSCRRHSGGKHYQVEAGGKSVYSHSHACSENLFAAYAAPTHCVAQGGEDLPPLDPSAGELGEDDEEEERPAAGVVAGGGGL